MKKGFSLMELIVTSVIVAVLAATAIPSFNTYIARTSDEVCSFNAATILSAIIGYTSVGKEIPPATYDMDGLNAILGANKVIIPSDYSATIIVVDKETFTVIIQDDLYLGTASIGN